MKIWKVLLIVLPLAGCVTTDDRGLSELLADRYTRAEVNVIVIEMQCKAQARTLIQMARCGVK